MAGIYIHIPFCKQRCTYCDFYTRVAPQQIPDLVQALCWEMKLRKDYLHNETIDTIYFGGGTPSLLSATQFEMIFSNIFQYFSISDDAEISFEANPDDLSPAFFDNIRHLPFNRISMGIQSFDDADLKLINRRHSGNQAIQAVKYAREAGFQNISIDLIYGLPGQTLLSWEKQLDQGLSLYPEHISIYGLTYERGTKLWKQREKGIVQETSEQMMIDMYELLIQKVKQAGYEDYEISNFAKKGFRSRHNSSYWKLTPYIGLGPSAHSYDGQSRQWNISSTPRYIEALKNKTEYFETETLQAPDKFNEYIMIALRTKEGLDINTMNEILEPKLVEKLHKNIQKYLHSGHIIHADNRYYFSLAGIHISNLIISDLMVIGD